jgi:hypothetical protein
MFEAFPEHLMLEVIKFQLSYWQKPITEGEAAEIPARSVANTDCRESLIMSPTRPDVERTSQVH